MTDITTLLAKVREEAKYNHGSSARKMVAYMEEHIFDRVDLEKGATLGGYWESTRLQPLIDKLVRAIEISEAALAFTQRTDVIVGNDGNAEDGHFRSMPDKIMMRNKCRDARESIAAILSEGEG